MEIYRLDRDVPIVCITATSFPLGILPAHEKLHSLLGPSGDRTFYGISRPSGNMGNIVYKAAAEIMDKGEPARLNLETMMIKKGTYLSELILNFHEDIQRIGKSFQQILDDPRIDPNGFCVEWYLNETDVRCMVRVRE